MSKGLKKVLLYSLIGAVVLGLLSGVVGGIIGYQAGSGRPVEVDDGLFWAMGAVAVIAMTGAMVSSVAWMRSIDEAAREAHKSAWFWGGCGGLCVGGVLFILASLPPAATLDVPAWFPDRTDPAAYAATGAALLALLMVAGYTLAWVWWWWERR